MGNFIKFLSLTGKTNQKLHAVFDASTEAKSSKLVQVLKTLPLLASIIVFTFLSIFLINPNTNQAQAATSTSNSDVNLNISEIIALSLKDCGSGNPMPNVNLNITPSYEGTFGSTCQKVTVNTNTPGYSLLVKAEDSNLTYQNPTAISPKPAIASTSATIASPATILDNSNTWGFGVEGMLNFNASYSPNTKTNTFASMPTSDITIYSVAEWPITKSDFNFYYGANLDMRIVAGDYKTNVTYTAVGEEVPEPPVYLAEVVSEANVTTMQQLTSTICQNADYNNTNNGNNANNTVVLNDTRNDQNYRVRKMADDKCWMIDNLKLATPGTALTLTSADTDIAEGQTFTIPTNPVTTVDNRRTNGTCVSGSPTGTTGYLSCDGTNNQSEANNKFIAYVDPNNTPECLNNDGTNTDYTYSPDSLTKCGYYYNWYTSTAGTGQYSTPTANNNASSSICPVNWHLPSAGDGTAATANEWAVLNGAMLGLGSNTPSILNDDTAYPNWRHTSALQGTYSGYWTNDFYSQGYYGYYWSSSVQSETNARSTRLLFDGVSPGSGGNSRVNGFSVRCVL